MYYRVGHLNIFLCIVVTSLILTGALGVGDSVKMSLHQIAIQRLGKVKLACELHDRFFDDQLSDQLRYEIEGRVASYIKVPSMLKHAGNGKRVNRAWLYGIDEHFSDLMELKMALPGEDEIVVNNKLAEAIGLQAGDEVLIKMERPGDLSKDISLLSLDDATKTVRVKVVAVFKTSDVGDFSLRGDQKPPMNIFINKSFLQKQLSKETQVNGLVIGEGADVDQVNKEIQKHWSFKDSSLKLRKLDGKKWDLSSKRFFIDRVTEEAIREFAPGARALLTFFVNGIKSQQNETPYSTMTAVTSSSSFMKQLGIQLKGQEMAVSDWLAKDLSLKVGDELKIRYFKLTNSRELLEKSSKLVVKKIYTLKGEFADPQLMPQMPGLTDADHCRDWKAGSAIDLKKIRPVDEVYWEKFKTSPKAIIHLDEGVKLWGNRYGRLTSMRFPSTVTDRNELEKQLLRHLHPAMIGLQVRDVRSETIDGVQKSFDFSGLFMAFSFFIILASLLLTGLVFGLLIEERTRELGLFNALGFRASTIRGVLRLELCATVLLASVLGALSSFPYTELLLWFMQSHWQAAIHINQLSHQFQFSSILTGAMLSFGISYIFLILYQRNSLKKSIYQLLSNPMKMSDQNSFQEKRQWTFWCAMGLLTLSVLLAMIAIVSESHLVEIFFLSGFSFFCGGALWYRGFLGKKKSDLSTIRNLNDLSISFIRRRLFRSMSIVWLFGCGIFLIFSIGVFRQDAGEALSDETTTGGFTWMMLSTSPVFGDLNMLDTRKNYDLEEDAFDKNFRLLSFRKREGDDASCLNLMRAGLPSIYGVNSKQMDVLSSFKIKQSLFDKKGGTFAEHLRLSDELVYALVEETTLMWNLKKKVGDILTYKDEFGKPVKVCIAGTLAPSVLQGQLLVSEEAYLKMYPSAGGYHQFLYTCNPQFGEEIRQQFFRYFENEGVEVFPVASRLEKFFAVQNTYLSIFEILGGLGLLLGTAGMAVVIFRNVHDRQSEFALMMALGFTRAQIKKMVFNEHWTLMKMGLMLGLASAALAVWPFIMRQPPNGSLARLIMTLCGVVALGFWWTAWASHSSLKSRLLDHLKRE